MTIENSQLASLIASLEQLSPYHLDMVEKFVQPLLPAAEAAELPIVVEWLHDASNEPLADWLERETEYSEDSLRTYYRPAIRWLSRHLSRVAVVSDLTPENVVACQQNCRYRLFSALRALWVQAVERGVVPHGVYGPDKCLLGLEHMLPQSGRPRIAREAIQGLSDMLGRPAVAGDLTRGNAIKLAKFLGRGTSYRKLRLRALADVARCVGVELDGSQLRGGHNRAEPMPVEVEGQLTVFGLLKKHYAPKRLLGKSKDTLRLYKISIRKFCRWLARPAMVSDFTDEQVGEYLQYLMDQTDNSPATIEKEAVQLLTLWRYASRRNMGPAWPEITPPKAPEIAPDSWSREELSKLLAACRAQSGEISGIPAGLWWESLISTVLDSAERIGALLQVKWSDISGEWLTVRAELRKGKRKPKRARLRASTQALLKRVKEVSPHAEVFPWSHSVGYLWDRFGKVLDDAGLPSDRRSKFHKLRRTVATMFEEAGGDATKLLGHSSRKVTENCYLDESRLTAVQAVDLIGEIT